MGAENGLGLSIDEGQSWQIVKNLVGTLSIDERKLIGSSAGMVEDVETYAAPNPFDPSEGEQARIVYSLSRDAIVTIKIYDFASRLVTTLVEGQMRAGPERHRDSWDGTSDGVVVANGVYFYRIDLQDGPSAFGKVVVLD